MRVATFNVQNLRLRKGRAGPRLDGARDSDDPADQGGGAGDPDRFDRRLTARVIANLKADVVALQEVFDLASLDHFHDHVLMDAAARPYPHRACFPGNDGRGLDVAVLSRVPFERVQSHAAATPGDLGMDKDDGDQPVFRRDCLEVAFRQFTLFVCHFKAPYPDASRAWVLRRREARAVRRLIERRFDDPAAGMWLVAGDLNEPCSADDDPAIAPLLPPFSVDLIARLPPEDRWSYRLPDGSGYGLPDALLASPALARANPDALPAIHREGLGHEADRYAGPRLIGVGAHRPHASDHAAIVVDLETP